MKKKFFIKNKRGLKIATIIEVPGVGYKHPAVIMFHGFKGYKEEATYSELAKELLNNNIGSVRFDATGFGESDGTLKDDYRLTNYLEDAKFVYNYCLKLKYFDHKRIGAFGVSMGGQVLTILSVRGIIFKAVVLVSTPDNIKNTDMKNIVDDWKEKGFYVFPSSLIGEVRIPYGFLEDNERYDLAEYVDKMKCNKLFVGGGKDENVGVGLVKRLYSLAAEPKKFIIIPKMGHFYKNDPIMLKRVNTVVVAFINNNL